MVDSSGRQRRTRERPQRTQAQIDRLNKLNADSRALLEQLANRLPPEAVAQYQRFGEVGEWGELVDNLCAGLVKRRIPVTEEERDRLAALLAMFGSREDYVYLKDPEQVLAQLVVKPD
ncbi:hypothetical protein [Nocardia sp. NPDC057353]|uniref:hypothetical protein n=1 Tax=Nocardia sp. NPDC057353 TaxID=3346104 RepID=UPI00362A4B65